MPDRADVENALAGLIAEIVYPTGPSDGSSIGAPCRVYRGWPTPRVLEEELGSGVVHITVQPVSGTMQNRTRFPSEWQGASGPTTMSGSVSGDVVSFAGEGSVGHVAGVRVDGRAYAYRLRSGDSTGLVAAALAQQIRADRPAIAIGSELHLIEGAGVVVRVVTDGIGGREVRRQAAGFRVTVWCPDPVTRDRAVGVIDRELAVASFLDVLGWSCRMQLSGDSSTDEGSAGGVWRRDLLYSIEYPTTVSETLAAMLFGTTDVNGVPFVA